MKTVGVMLISVLTTVVTMFALIYFLDVELVMSGNDSILAASNVETATMREVTILNQEEAQMDAIDRVAQAIVGVVSITEGFGGFFGFSGEQAGTGSGIVYAVQNGATYIVTNEHVVDRATSIEVVFNDEEQTRVEATLVGSDVYTDLAILRIPDFEADVIASFGRTEDLRLGQTVIAIGNPLGLEFAGSATMGVVSGHDRSVPISILSTNGQMQDWTMTVLQTDTAINPGNSGGALINLAGEVVGINSMKIAQSAVEGMSFSIPTYIALPIIEDLEAYGVVTRPLLGVSLRNLNMAPSALRHQLNVPETVLDGVFIDEVMVGSFAQAIGIEIGDIITHIGEVEILESSTFRQVLFTYRHGDDITFTIVRNGAIFDLEATIVIADSHVN